MDESDAPLASPQTAHCQWQQATGSVVEGQPERGTPPNFTAGGNWSHWDARHRPGAPLPVATAGASGFDAAAAVAAREASWVKIVSLQRMLGNVGPAQFHFKRVLSKLTTLRMTG